MIRMIWPMFFAVALVSFGVKASSLESPKRLIDCKKLVTQVADAVQSQDKTVKLSAINNELAQISTKAGDETDGGAINPATLKCSNGVSAFRTVAPLLDGESIRKLTVFHHQVERFDDFFPTLMFPISLYASIDLAGLTIEARLSSVSALMDLGASPIAFECQGEGCIVCHSPIQSAVARYRLEKRKCGDSAKKECPAVEAQERFIELMLSDDSLLSKRVCGKRVSDLLSSYNVVLDEK